MCECVYVRVCDGVYTQRVMLMWTRENGSVLRVAIRNNTLVDKDFLSSTKRCAHAVAW